MTVSSVTPFFLLETQDFHWRPFTFHRIPYTFQQRLQTFHRRPQTFIGDPFHLFIFFKFFVLNFHWRLPGSHWRPQSYRF